MFKNKFGSDDVFVNRIKTYPRYDFYIYNSNIFINNQINQSGSHASNVLNVPNGFISLYELNINRASGNNAYPFVVAGSDRFAFRFNRGGMKGGLKQPNVNTYSENDVNKDLQKYIYPSGSTNISSSYPMSASITRKLTTGELITFAQSNQQPSIYLNRTASALAVAARKYTTMSPHFVFQPTGSVHFGSMYGLKSNAGRYGKNSTFLTRSLISSKEANMIFIPNIFYGSTIKRGSVSLKFYMTGALLAEATDIKKNGELVQVTGSGSGSTVGVVMYDEGVIILTSSRTLDTGPLVNVKYAGSSGAAKKSSWMYYGVGLNDGITYDNSVNSASFGLQFEGTNYVNTMTMFCHAEKGELNHSNNPTYKKISTFQALPDMTGSLYSFKEKSFEIRNVVSSSYAVSESFRKTVYVSKIGIYDENHNLIGVAATSYPIKKEEADDMTFKLKIDL